MIQKLKKNSKGFSLVELLIAVTIMAVIVLPMLQVFTLAADFTRRSRDKGEATAAAQNIQETIQTRGVESFRASTDDGRMQDSVALSMLGADPIPQSDTSVADDGTVTMRGVTVGSKTFDALVRFDRDGEETNIGGVNKSIGLSINDVPVAKYTALTGTTSGTFPQPYTAGQNPDNLADQSFAAANPGASFVKRARKINITVTSAPDTEKGGYLVYVDVQFVYDYYKTASVKFPNPVELNYPIWSSGQHIDSYDDEISLFLLYYAFYENTAAENINIYVDRDNATSDLVFKAFIIKQVPMIQLEDGTYVNAIDAGDAGTEILNKDRSYKLVINEYHNSKFNFNYDASNPPPEAMNVYTNANKQLENRNLDIADFKYRIKKPQTSGFFNFSKATIEKNQLVKTEAEDRFFHVTIEIYQSGALDGENPSPVYTLNADKLK